MGGFGRVMTDRYVKERAWLRNIYESNGAGIDAGMNREPKRESGDPLPIYPYGKELGMQ